MIYVCIPSHNEGPTVGLLLWKIRQVFTEFSREYQLVDRPQCGRQGRWAWTRHPDPTAQR